MPELKGGHMFFKKTFGNVVRCVRGAILSLAVVMSLSGCPAVVVRQPVYRGPVYQPPPPRCQYEWEWNRYQRRWVEVWRCR